MNPKKGLVGKEMKPTAPAGGAKPGMGKPALGGKGTLAKEFPAKGAGSRNLLSVEDVAERLRVSEGHVESWLKDGILKGSLQGVQLYELEKFRAKHHRDIQQAQNSPPPVATSKSKAMPSGSTKTLGKKGKSADPPAATAPPPPPMPPVEAKKGGGPLGLVASILTSVFSVFGGKTPKPAKVAPYVQPPPLDIDDEDDFQAAYQPPAEPASEIKVAPVHATAQINPAALQAAMQTGELIPPAPPSSEVWPSLEGATASAETPAWLTKTSVEGPSQHETLILKNNELVNALKSQAPTAPPGASNRELQEEKQRNQQLLLQLQEQRRAELELQDEIETLKQRLELSLSGEREVRSQLKRARQELQTALEELEQRSPAGGSDPESLRQMQERESQWLAEKAQLEQHRVQLEQRKTLLEQQIERLRSQAEEIRQHGLQWHQLATQQDQQLKTLRQQHSELEQEAGKALGELEKKLRDAEAQRARAETLAEQAQSRAQALEQQMEQLGSESAGASLQLENKAKDRTIEQLQASMDQLTSKMSQMETQQRAQVQRWEQELQASAGWVQKLTEAVTVRDRRIQELEVQLAQNSSRAPTFSEEELKSQVMSLRVELTSLRRNYEIVSLQAKNLENQLQENRRTSPPGGGLAAPPPLSASPPLASAPGLAAPPPMTSPPLAAPPGPSVLSLELPTGGLAAPPDEEGGFRRRLKQRLGSLGPSFEEDSRKRGLEPPPFLELDIPES